MQPLFLFPLAHRYFVLSLFRFFILLDFQLIIVLVIGLGVSGGTASGKTTVCDMIIQQLHDHRVVLVNQVSRHGLLLLKFLPGCYLTVFSDLFDVVML